MATHYASFAASSSFAAPPPVEVNAFPPRLRGSSSFMDIEGCSSSMSPDTSSFPPRAFTPQPPDVAAQRRQSHLSTGNASDALSDASTLLADFPPVGMTPLESPAMPGKGPAGDYRPLAMAPLESPAMPGKSPRLPSVPSKFSRNSESSTSRKGTPPWGADSPSDEGGFVVVPRALSGALNQTDLVNDLVENVRFAQRLALSTPPGDPNGRSTPPSTDSMEGGVTSLWGRMEAQLGSDGAVDQRHRPSSHAFALTEAEQRKRQKNMQPAIGRSLSMGSSTDEDGSMPPPLPRPSSSAAMQQVLRSASSGSTASDGGSGGATSLDPPYLLGEGRGGEGRGLPGTTRGVPALHRGNSMADTKVLFSTAIARLDKKHGSFAAAPVGTRDFVFEDKFTWGPLLGRGSFADVYVVFHNYDPSTRKAVKVSNKAFRSRGERAKYVHEVELANELGTHTNIVEYYTAWQEDQKFYMLMELCGNGTLRDHLRREGAQLRLPDKESAVWDIVLHVARGLVHMHGMRIIHCDLKPDNILISADGAFKIGDLGLATTIDQWREGMEGDAVYLSRDLLNCAPSVFADIFSLGLMLYEIVSGERLPGCETPEDRKRWNELRDPLSPDQPTVPRVQPPSTCSAHMQRLVARMMSPVAYLLEPGDARPTAQEVLNATMGAMVSASAAAGVPRRRI